MEKELACRNCKTLTRGRVCPNCHSSDLSVTWSGLVVVVDSTKSAVSQALGLTKPGRYALKVV